MKLAYVFILNAIFALVGSLGLLLMPMQLLASQGATLNEAGVYIAQLMGMVMLGISFISWQVRNLKDKNLLTPILTGFAIIHLGIVIFNIEALNTNLVNSSGWGDVVLHTVLGLGFLYFLLNPKKI